jgi:hypothetical protein
MPHDSLTAITARRLWGTQANWRSFAPPRWRADAFALVRTHGGKPREGVTKHTDVPPATLAGHLPGQRGPLAASGVSGVTEERRPRAARLAKSGRILLAVPAGSISKKQAAAGGVPRSKGRSWRRSGRAPRSGRRAKADHRARV